MQDHYQLETLSTQKRYGVFKTRKVLISTSYALSEKSVGRASRPSERP